MTASLIRRRTLLGALALPWVTGCSSPLPLVAAPPSQADAVQRVRDSAQAHGWPAYRALGDINVGYSGQWGPLVGRIQPEVVDPGFRGSSQERLMPGLGLSGQAHVGPQGRKQVWWHRDSAAPGDLGEVAVWFNGVRSDDPAAQRAAALVAEGYSLFLLGPLRLAERGLPMRLAGSEQVDGRSCDVVDVWVTPGLGQVAADRVSLWIDRHDALTRRIRFTLEGFAATQGAVAQVDTFDHDRRFGIVWPMRFYESVLHPIALPAHDWHVTGLDVNRGYAPQALLGPQFTGAAAPPARPV